ncbi:SET domain-containing protein [Durusdinium trenchii]|uniref:SET domain-containing protein n=1 Tax=Durusdinium trenchii TaxID=1381693 RepID=A0ABP0N1T9_9DINO
MTNTKDKEAKGGEEDESEPRWRIGDRVYALWAGNNCYYVSTIAEVSEADRTVVVTWDDADTSHRRVSFDQVMRPSDETTAWSRARIEKRATVRHTKQKGRCLFTNEACEPGQVVFVERPLLVALPAVAPKLWECLQKLHEEPGDIDVIRDKYVPEPDEEPNEDVIRILKALQDAELDGESNKICKLEAKSFQRLVSAWRYNSFGHHKEDGLVLYNRISMCAHSCDPTCCWSYGDEDAFVLRSRMALEKGGELTISYLQDEDLLKSTSVRQQKLQNWKFTCMCPRCSLKVDVGRGIRCQRCKVGVLYPQVPTGGFETCKVCGSSPSSEDTQMLLNMEEEYVARVDSLDKKDLDDVQTVYQAALDIFERHWILYVMDTILWEGQRQKNIMEAMEHQRRRIDFHQHYYFRPTFILAWCHEELGDCMVQQFPSRKWHLMQEFQRAYQMLAILCGTTHQYTASPYNKLWQVSSTNNSANANGANTETSESRKPVAQVSISM